MSLIFDYINDSLNLLDNTTKEYKAIKAMKVEEFIEYQENLKSRGCRVMYIESIDAYQIYEYIHKEVPGVRFRMDIKVRRVTTG